MCLPSFFILDWSYFNMYYQHVTPVALRNFGWSSASSKMGKRATAAPDDRSKKDLRTTRVWASHVYEDVKKLCGNM